MIFKNTLSIVGVGGSLHDLRGNKLVDVGEGGSLHDLRGNKLIHCV
jgi:hypothetical protein